MRIKYMSNTTVIRVITTTKMIMITIITTIMTTSMTTITIVTIITTAIMMKMTTMLIWGRMGVLSSLAALMATAQSPGLLDLPGQHGMGGMVATLQSQVLRGWTGTTLLRTRTTRRKEKYRLQGVWECTTPALLQI